MRFYLLIQINLSFYLIQSTKHELLETSTAGLRRTSPVVNKPNKFDVLSLNSIKNNLKVTEPISC